MRKRTLTDRRLPENLRLQEKPDFSNEERAIIRFVNGDTDIHRFIGELKQCEKEQ